VAVVVRAHPRGDDGARHAAALIDVGASRGKSPPLATEGPLGLQKLESIAEWIKKEGASIAFQRHILERRLQPRLPALLEDLPQAADQQARMEAQNVSIEGACPFLAAAGHRQLNVIDPDYPRVCHCI